MISLTLDIQQQDCPYATTSGSHDVSLTGLYSDYVEPKEKLKTRMVVQGESRETVSGALDAFEQYDAVNLCHLIAKWEDKAIVKNCTDPTSAMEVVRRHEGYLTAPFEVRSGRKRWYLGFDSREQANAALSDLEGDHEFDVESWTAITREQYVDVLENVSTAKALLDACRELTEVEREALTAAYEQDYFQTPRETTLVELAEQFGVSDTALSNSLRRSHERILEPVVAAIDELDDADGA